MKTRKCRAFRRLLCLAIAAILGAPAAAANRVFIEAQTLVIEKTTRVPKEPQWIAVRFQNDDVEGEVYGFQIAFKFEPSKIKVNSIELVDEAYDAEWCSLPDIDPVPPPDTVHRWFLDETSDADTLAYINSTGEVYVGTIMDYSPSGVPANDNVLPLSASQRVILISVDVLASAPGSALIDFVDTLKNPQTQITIKNVFTDKLAETIPPVQEDRSLPIVSWKPEIQSPPPASSGWAGVHFQLEGLNFDKPGLSVEVCGTAAAAVLQPDEITLDVTAPSCPSMGLVPVTVRTDYGEDTEPLGFQYVPLPVPHIASVSPSDGWPGRTFQVVGDNFGRPGLSVKVCGKTLSAAEAVLRPDGITIDVTAPECALGPSTVEVCNDVGCDSEPFTYLSLFIRADANADGNVDLSDAIEVLFDLFFPATDPAAASCRAALDADGNDEFQITDVVYILNFLFLDGDEPLPPYPDPGPCN